jgi:hypothetical protein
MIDCKRDGGDRLLQELVAHGLNIILPPRHGVSPGDLVLAEANRSSRVADWTIVLGIDPKPAISHPPSFRSLEFKTSDELAVELGASVAGRVLHALGVPAGALSAAFKASNATRLDIKLTAPAVSELDNIDEILEALRTAKAKPAPDYADRRILVVNRVWRARGLSLGLRNQAGAQVNVQASVAQELQAKAKVEVKDRNDGRLTFVAPEALIFATGFREIAFEGGGVQDVTPTEHFHLRVVGDGLPSVPASDDSLFLDLDGVED